MKGVSVLTVGIDGRKQQNLSNPKINLSSKMNLPNQRKFKKKLKKKLKNGCGGSSLDL